jgi:hypothetical protein
MRGVRLGLLGVLVIAVAGCGAGADTVHQADAESGRQLAGVGLAVELPDGWSGRIVLGSEGRPVLHAANYPLPATDDDAGSVAQETIGSRGQAYLNVRELGGEDGGSPPPVSFVQADYGAPPADGRCCFVTVARRDVVASGRTYRVTVASGSDDPPSDGLVASVNAVLASLAFEPYELDPVSPPSGGERLAGRGIEVTLPAGWRGHVGDEELALASFDWRAAEEPGAYVPRDDIVLLLREQGGSDAPFVTARLPFRLVPTEFVPAEFGARGTSQTGHSFVASGRRFVLWASAGSLRPTVELLAEANAALASLRIEPGDFYPGLVEPATFEEAAGWHTGTSGPAEIEPGGTQTASWAATIPYRDEPFQFAPHETLAALPPDGIAIVVWLSAGRGSGRVAPERALPYMIDQAEEGSFEGVPADRALYRIGASSSGRDVTVWIFFGRRDPNEEQLARAQAELDRLRLPAWPAR